MFRMRSTLALTTAALFVLASGVTASRAQFVDKPFSTATEGVNAADDQPSPVRTERILPDGSTDSAAKPASADDKAAAQPERPSEIDQLAKDHFNTRLFAGALKTSKTYACFVRRYDTGHLAAHPKQKVAAMKLLVTAEKVPEDAGMNYSFRLGIKFRNRSGNFDSSGSCGHLLSDESGHELRLGCSVECDGGGIDVALANDDKSTVVKFERVHLWNSSKPDDEVREELVAGSDDKVFRLDRISLKDCESLVNDREELAALRHK